MSKSNRQGGSTVANLVIFVLLVVCIGGWVANIYKLVHMDFVWGGMIIVRAVGIFVAPLGAVMGFI